MRAECYFGQLEGNPDVSNGRGPCFALSCFAVCAPTRAETLAISLYQNLDRRDGTVRNCHYADCETSA